MAVVIDKLPVRPGGWTGRRQLGSGPGRQQGGAAQQRA